MNFEELEKIVQAEAGVSICPICKTPFKPYHSRQITCAAEECRKSYRSNYLKERNARLKAQDEDMWRKKHTDAQRRSRHKKREFKLTDENLKKAQAYWKKREAQHYTALSDGKEYAERQIANTLAKVPKIDVNIGKENEK